MSYRDTDQITFSNLWDRSNSVDRETRGTYIARRYHAFYNAEAEQFEIRFFADYKPELEAPIIAKLNALGDIWFVPYITLRDNYKSSTEEYLLQRLLPNTTMRNHKAAKERGVAYYDRYGKRIVVSAGEVQFNVRRELVSAAPPRCRVITGDVMAEYDALLENIQTDAVLRARFTDLLVGVPPGGFVRISSPDVFLHEVRKVKPGNYNTYKALAQWANRRYRRDGVSLEEAVVKMFKAWRPKVMEYVGAVKYV